MKNKGDSLDKYFLGFNFQDKEKPFLLVGDGSKPGDVKIVKIITDKSEVESLYKRLIEKDPS